MKTRLDKNTIHERFVNHTRPWAVKLSINGWPANHPGVEPGAAVVTYHPAVDESNDRAFERFVEVVERAARGSLFGPVILNIAFVEECRDSVVDWLKTLLKKGPEMFWMDGSRAELNPENLYVNLWLDENHPGTVCVINRIVGE